MADEKIIPPCFVGELVITPFQKGLWRVVNEFRFIDKKDKQWAVPAGMLTDGASIPKALQLIFGHPFMSDYVKAAVIHDFYCDKRIEAWRATHEMFYEALLVNGTPERKAKLMLAGVLFGNRKWGIQTEVTSSLSRPDNILFFESETDFQRGLYDAVSINGKSAGDVKRGSGMWVTGNETTLDFDQVRFLIERDDPSIAEIERAMRKAIEMVEPPYQVEDEERVRTIVVSGVQT